MAPLSFPQAQPLGSMQGGMQAPNIPQIKPGGMFGGGGNLGSILAAALAGYTASSNPGPQQALFAAMAQKRKQAEEDQQYQRDRQDKRSDFTFEQDYKAAHDVPDIQQRVGVLNSIHPGLGDTYAQNYAANGGGLGQIFKDPATGQSYAIGGASAPAAGPQPGMIEQGFRFKGGNPADPHAWEPVNGGQAAPPPATFP